MFFDSSGEFRREVGLKAGMFTIAETPQHVCTRVRALEEKNRLSLERLAQVHHSLSLPSTRSQGGVRGLIQFGIIQTVVLLRHAEGGE